MTFLIIMMTLTALGLGIIAFLLIREKRTADRSLRLSIPEAVAPAINSSVIETKENLTSENISEEEKHAIEKEVHISFELEELKEKYARLERMLNEKNTELEQTKQFLDSELTAKKEFNKFKDILEKEIKENKDKGVALKSQLNIVKTENENANRRIEQFEEKALSLERELLAKQQENERILGQLKTAEVTIKQLKEQINTLEEKQKEQAALEPQPTIQNEPQPQTQTDSPAVPPISEEKSV